MKDHCSLSERAIERHAECIGMYFPLVAILFSSRLPFPDGPGMPQDRHTNDIATAMPAYRK
jgi:hypothetical protein